MERRFVIGVGIVTCLLAMMLFANPIWAGGTQSGFEPPPPGAIITGPELWGVVTVYNSPSVTFATIRLKRVDDCNTETLTFVDPAWDSSLLPATAEDATNLTVDSMQQRLESEWGTTGNPFISKVKNFVREDDLATGVNIISFDAMFEFWTQ